MLANLLQQAQAAHEHKFGSSAQWTATAPGRVNLIGDHTDYTDGFALPFAIDRYTIITASPIAGAKHQVHTTLGDETAEFTLGEPVGPAKTAQWYEYIRGVLSLMAEVGFTPPSLALGIHGNLPIGSGLSSSASLELAMATLIEGICGRQLPSLEKILLCQQVEHRYTNVPCGILDQFSICQAQDSNLLLLDCREQTAQPIPINADAATFLVIDSQVRHQHSGGGYAQRRKECFDAQEVLGSSLRDASASDLEQISDLTVRRRAIHVVSENARVSAFATAMQADNLTAAGKLMNSSHASLRDDFEVSTPEVDQLVDIAQSTNGVFGARMTGGGFGGSVIAMVEPNQAGEAASQIRRQYERVTQHVTDPLAVAAVSGCDFLTNSTP